MKSPNNNLVDIDMGTGIRRDAQFVWTYQNEQGQLYMSTGKSHIYFILKYQWKGVETYMSIPQNLNL